jgi:hypothetical protein
MPPRKNAEAVDGEREYVLRWLRHAWNQLFSTVREREESHAPQREAIGRLQVEVRAGGSPAVALAKGRQIWDSSDLREFGKVLVDRLAEEPYAWEKR